MVDNVPRDVQRAFERHDAIEATEDGFEVTTTPFDSTVTAESIEESTAYYIRVSVPNLDAATRDEVGPTVALDWFETFERRLEDAPKTVRERVDLTDFTVEETEGLSPSSTPSAGRTQRGRSRLRKRSSSTSRGRTSRESFRGTSIDRQ